MKGLITLISLVFSMSAAANIIITGTRVIYPANQQAVSVQLTNQTETPALMQAWLDDGDAHSSPATLSSTRVPFVIVPPVSRIEANAGQSLRIRYTGKSPLPQDRESVFYLNVLDIPPKPKKEELGTDNYLQISLRSRIKFFYRPELPMKPSEAYRAVTFSAVPNGVKIDNRTPYFVTYGAVKIANRDIGRVGMVAPFSSSTVATSHAKAGSKVEWSVINDFGGDEKGESVVR